ncbi:MAG: hypothetical protein KF833_06985 [Verrucomicrobiae bacterium]|nr:hypothetical protein [Verrucomicrobiae bacterium]
MARTRNRGAKRTVGYASTVTSGLLVCFAVAVALLGYIRLKGDLHRMETELGNLDRTMARLKRDHERLHLDYETMVSSAGLDQRVRAMRLNLVTPGESARVVLPEPPRELPVPASGRGVERGWSRREELAMGRSERSPHGGTH